MEGLKIECGVLYVVSTPVGNLNDITLRALEVLESVDVIACEDTRHTRKLLSHYSITNPLLSYFDYNKFSRGRLLIERLKKGESVALVSDSGTPGISDPGYFVVNLAIDEGIKVVPIPGPSALLAALAVSGAPIDRFTFGGYLPPKQNKRRGRLALLKDEPRTMVFYEAPHRLLRCLEDMMEVLGDRKVIIGRELTKRFEEMRRESLSEAMDHFKTHAPRGEFVIILPAAHSKK